jgi:hypothetical protein
MSGTVTLTFSTGGGPDLTAPTIVNFSPAANATGVSTSTKVTIQFSKAMDSAALNGQTVTGIPGSYTYDPNTFTATLTPSATLQPNSTYTMTVSGQIKDLYGNVMGQDFTWKFTTGQ